MAVLLKVWPATLLLSALSAKDFAEAIVKFFVFGFLGEGARGWFDCFFGEANGLGWMLRLRMPTFVIEHQARHALLPVCFALRRDLRSLIDMSIPDTMMYVYL